MKEVREYDSEDRQPSIQFDPEEDGAVDASMKFAYGKTGDLASMEYDEDGDGALDLRMVITVDSQR